MDGFVSSLLCQEKEAELVEEEEEEEESYILQLELEQCSVSEEEYVQILMEREMGLIGLKRQLQESNSVFGEYWLKLKTPRLDAINWILKTRATFGFRFQTAYLSLTYFDRFLSTRSIDSQKCWAFRLLSIACLSLAAKMEECDVPLLSEFPLQDYNFETKVIQRMELLVLTTLEWKMAFITPFALLPYFITKFSNQSPPPSHIWSNTSQLILTLTKGVNLMDHKPSVIAAAATLVALDPQMTRKAIESKMISVSQYVILETENVFLCYDLIQRLYMEKFKTNKFVHSLNPSPIQSRAIDMLESSLVSSAAMSKRRKLTFNDHKQGHSTHDDS